MGDNIKMYRREIDCEDVNIDELSEYMIQQRQFMKTVLDSLDFIPEDNLLTTLITVYCSK
jgi:hypothetical protein